MTTCCLIRIVARDKKSHRAYLRDLRRRVSPGQAAENSRRATEHLLAYPAWSEARSVGIYLHRDGEMPSSAIIAAARAAEKVLCLPCVENDGLRFRHWEAQTNLRVNRFGIEEPGHEALPAGRLDLLLTPLVGWAWGGYRLGMGGGFFDRYLVDSRPRLCLGLAYECQRDDELAALRNDWDQDVDGVLTEAGVYRFDD